MYSTLISVEQLQALQQAGAPVMLFDCSFDLMQPAAGQAQYAQAHIPGAVYAHLDSALSGKDDPAAPSGGRHPLPSREKLAAWLGSVGFGNGMQAVVYDRNGCNYCGRLWWMLQWLGHEAVAVLDGGLQAWQAAGGLLESQEQSEKNLPFPKQKYLLNHDRRAFIATETVAKQLGTPRQTLVDARAAPRYRGEVEPLDPIAGHIPGALNRPFAQNFGADGKFKPAAVLRAEFDALLAGRDPASVVHHCGSGVSAVPNLLAMEIAGFAPTALYAGSWSEWSRTPGLPCAKS